MFQLGSGEYGGFGGAWLILTTLNEMSYYPGDKVDQFQSVYLSSSRVRGMVDH